jgi:hypothetical protein
LQYFLCFFLYFISLQGMAMNKEPQTTPIKMERHAAIAEGFDLVELCPKGKDSVE